MFSKSQDSRLFGGEIGVDSKWGIHGMEFLRPGNVTKDTHYELSIVELEMQSTRIDIARWSKEARGG
jgi:hypothetical protein